LLLNSISNTVLGIALCVLFDLSGSRDVISIQSRNHLIPRRPYPIGGPWNHASISNGFRDIQRWMTTDKETYHCMPTTVA